MPRKEGEGYRKFYPNTVMFHEADFGIGGKGTKSDPALSLEAGQEIEDWMICVVGLNQALIGTLALPNVWVEDIEYFQPR